MSGRLNKKLKTSPALAVKLKLKYRHVIITSLSIAVLVAMRVFSFCNFGTSKAVNGAEKVHIKVDSSYINSSIKKQFADSLERKIILPK